MPADERADSIATPTSEATIPAVQRPRGAHVPELDGMRALAIWAVLAVHLFYTPPATAASRAFLWRPVASLFEHGWLGVDLFFVLSGFLITGILLETKSRGTKQYFRRFYIRRVGRILPLYFVVLLVMFVALRGAYGPFFSLCALMSANFASVFNVATPDAAGPYWSLAVEEQFYLIWPWLVLWLGRRQLALSALAVVVIEPLLRLGAPAHRIELVWYRADGLAMGAFLAVWFGTWNGDGSAVKKLALALVGAAVVITVGGIPFGILHEGILSTSLRITQAVCLFGALLAVSVGFSGRPYLAILRSRATSVTAVLSYCIYLIHKPLTDGFAWAVRDVPAFARLSPEAGLLVRSACVIVLAYGIAALSRRFLELPFIRLAAKS